MTSGRRTGEARARGAAPHARIGVWISLALLAGFLAVVPLPQALTPRAAAAAALEVTQSIPGQTLIGAETPVEVSFRNTGDERAFNVAFAVTLPLGVSVSSADEAPTRTIVETDSSGNPLRTVVVWENLVDVAPGSVYRFRYSLQHDAGTGTDEWQVDETIDAPVDAYFSTDDADVPHIEPDGTTDPISAVFPGAEFEHATADGSTLLVPILLTKSEPSPESELLRGVHDHQTVYTLSAQTGSQGGVGVTTVEDWIPAGLEFLGCGTTDNSTTGEEYPGSGPLNPGNAPSLGDVPCFEPSSVETVDTDPDGAGSMPSGVYTHVTWDFADILPGGGNTIPADSTVSIAYVAAIPQRANTLTWRNAEPTPASGRQAANLDNNTGAFTTQGGDGNPEDGATYTNYVEASTEFEGDTTTVSARETVQAVDLAMYKTVDTTTIVQGGISTWTLHLRSSEYVVADGVDDLTVTDVTPDGTCPIGSANPNCSGTTSPPPNPAYTDSSYNPSTGETTLTWDVARTIGPSQTGEITFSTVALTTYVGGIPVSANDTWTNTADLAAQVTTFGPLGPSRPAGFDGPNDVTDDTSREQSGTSIEFRKDVGVPANGASCDDGSEIIWSPELAEGVGPGDRVCFRLTAKGPDYLNTSEPSLVDFLPPGLAYEVGSAQPGTENQVPQSEVVPATPSGTPATGQRLEWTLSAGNTVRPAQTAQVVFSALVSTDTSPDDAPDTGTSGDQLTNNARYSFQNTNGEVYVQRDNAVVTFSEAELSLAKGITEVDRPGSSPDDNYPPPGVPQANDVVAGTSITYLITVTNDGTRDAFDIEVWDLLPRHTSVPADPALDATCTEIDASPQDGLCDDGRITWTEIEVPAGDSVTLSYTWSIPPSPGVPVGAEWTNHAGVVEYRATTNTGTDFTYVPRDNIDPSREADANTEPADDTAKVFSPGITLTKTRTTSVSEPGNAASNQATIGETIHYTVLARQSGGTAAEDFLLVDDLTTRGQDLDAGSVEVSYGVADPVGAACVYSPPTTTGVTVTGDRIEVSRPGVTTPDLDTEGCFRLTFDATVEDVNANIRPGSVANVVDLSYDVDPTAGVETRSLQASVSTQVVEPNIRVTKTSDTTSTVLPGTAVTYHLTVTNGPGNGVSVAHDVNVVDDLSDVPHTNVTYAAGDEADIELADELEWLNIGDLAPGASRTLTFTVTLDSPLVAGQVLTNGVTARTSSLDGPGGGERTAGSSCSPGTCPGYVDTDDLPLTVAGPTFQKTTGTTLTTLGSIARYTVTATFPAGLIFGTTSISDNLAGDRTTFLRTVDGHCTRCSADELVGYVPPEDNGTAGGQPRWDLGDLQNSNLTRVVTITYDTRVLDLPANDAGATITNTATLTYDADSLTDDASVPTAEPEVAITKRVATPASDMGPTTSGDPALGLIGGTITYRLDIENTGGWPAYDVPVVDLPDSTHAASCSDTPRLEVEEVTSGPGYLATDTTLGIGDGCLGFLIPVVFAGQTVTITYQLRVPDDYLDDFTLDPGPDFVNVAEVGTYWGLAEDDRTGEARSYAGPSANGYVDLLGGELGDTVWLDVNADGVQDAGEPGIPDVEVTATWAGPNDTFGDGDDVDFVRTTDEDGIWLTNDATMPPPFLLPAGDYRVTVDTGTLPLGLVNTYDASGPLDSTSEVTLGENETNLDQDFGYAGDQSLGDTVWLDLDADGVQDPGEPGIPDVDLGLTWAGPDGDLGTSDDVDYGTVTTDADGLYLAANLPAGDIEVAVVEGTLPGGLEPAYDLDDGTTAPDGVAVRALAVGEDATDVDFGYAGTGSVGDTVWFDIDGDGDQDVVEPGIEGVDVEVVWSGFGDTTFGDGNEVAVTVTTVDGGTYLVSGVPAGAVRVTVDTGTLPGGLTATYDLDGGLDSTADRALAGGEHARDVDFGYTGTHEIGDMVWLDVNGDGDGPRTPGTGSEPGVADQRVRVVWAGPDGDLGTADDVTLGTPQTGADGGWSLERVPDGDVQATLVGAPANTMRVSYDREGALDGVGIATVTGDDLDFDFGLAGTGSLGDTVWLDFNENGVVDADEPRIPNVDVIVTWAGPDGDLATTGDNVDYGAWTTDTDGVYIAENLPPGRFRAVVDLLSLPPGLLPVYDLDGISTPHTAVRVLAEGEDARDVDFGYVGSGRIGDFVWWDLNGDSVQDPTEPGFAGVGVTLDWAGFNGTFGDADDGRLSTSTDGAGEYLFRGLPAGSYRVTIAETDLPAGIRPTADPDGGDDSTSVLTLAAGASDLDQDFGYVGDSEIGDLVWRDVNDDGTRQDDEPAIAGARVTVTYLGPDGVEGGGDDVAITQRTGNPPTTEGRAARGGAPIGDDPFYLVAGLAPGGYVVTLDGDSIEAPDAPSSDLDGGDPTVTRLTLTDAPRLDVDFAVFQNDDPEFDGGGAAGAAISVECDGTVVVDPFAFVTDANGDRLRIVPGSIRVPADVTAERTDNGKLRIGTSGDEDFTVRYQVADGRGGVVEVVLPISVSAPCDDGSGGLPDTGSSVPAWLLWLALALVVVGGSMVVIAVRRRRG